MNKKMEELQEKLLAEMEEIPEGWKTKVHESLTRKGMYYTHYVLGRDFTKGYDYIMVYFHNKMSIKIFLNKHHEQCF